MEITILMTICMVPFVGVTLAFRFLMSDPQQGTLIGAIAGLLIAIAAGGLYYSYLAACHTCP